MPCRLTDSEVLAKGEQLAAARLKIEELKDRRKELNEKISARQDEVLELAQLIDARAEEREVKCVWIEDFTHKVKKLIRQDTGEEVESCTMTAADLQDDLPMGPDDDDDIGDDLSDDELGGEDIDGDDLDPPMREHLDEDPDEENVEQLNA